MAWSPRTGARPPGCPPPHCARAPLPELSPALRLSPAASVAAATEVQVPSPAAHRLPARPPASAPGLHGPSPATHSASPPPHQMQAAVALPEEIRWLLAGNALALGSPSSAELKAGKGTPAPPRPGFSFRHPPPSRTSRLLESSTLPRQIFILLPQGLFHSPQFLHIFFFLKASPPGPPNLRGF